MFDSGPPSERSASVPALAEAIALDINFLPERHRGRRLRFAALRPWLMMIGFGLLLIPAWQMDRLEAARLRQVEAEFTAVSLALEDYQPLADERSRLEARIAAAEAELAAIQDAYRIIDIQLQTWSDLVPRLLAAAPPGIELTSISQSSLEVTLEGLAQSETQPAQYRDQLEALGDFVEVTIQHVTRIVLEDAEPTATRAANEITEGEAERDEPPAAYRFEIRLELPAPEPAIPMQAAPNE